MKHINLGDTVYFHFAANDTSGSGSDGTTPAAHVRQAGDAASAAPIISPTPALLTHANYPAGCHEVAVVATVGNGFSAAKQYAVFSTLLVDSQNPTGMIGEFAVDEFITADLTAIKIEVNKIGSPAGASVSADIAAVKAQTAAIEADTQDIQTNIGVPAGVSVSADIAAVKAVADAVSVETDGIATIDGKVDTIDGNVDAILLDTGTDGVVVAAASKTDYALSTAGVDAI
ncbi:MAG: hypothetical protein ACRD4B_05430, partial [Acidobacteriota bacterium]